MKIISKNGIDNVILHLGQGNTVEIYDIGVYSERGKGIGTGLVNEAISFSKQAGCTSMYAFTRFENKLARSFYAKLGFSEIIIPRYYSDGDGVIVYKTI